MEFNYNFWFLLNRFDCNDVEASSEGDDDEENRNFSGEEEGDSDGKL